MLNPEKVKLAIAPIGWTNDDMPDLGAENTFEQCISEMALAGFSGAEIGNKYPSDPAVLKPYLDIRGLQICNAWFSSYLTSKPYEETIAAFKQHCDKLHALGAKVIGASEQGNSIQGCLDKSILDEKPVYTEEQWQTVARGFNEMGAYARSKGMYFTVHHHMGTGVQTAEEIDRLMELTDPELVFLLFDSGHLTFAGIDPVPVLEKYAHRVKHVHLKDVRLDVYNNRVVPEHMSFLDAVRAGVLDPATLPRECTAVLGETKSQRITTMIQSILAHSDGDVAMGAEEEEAFLALKDFMYANVYNDRTAKREEQKVEKVLTELYEYYLTHIDQMSNFYVQLAYQEGRERAVTDYISGMSDEFAIRTFEELFVPQKWHVL